MPTEKTPQAMNEEKMALYVAGTVVAVFATIALILCVSSFARRSQQYGCLQQCSMNDSAESCAYACDIRSKTSQQLQPVPPLSDEQKQLNMRNNLLALQVGSDIVITKGDEKTTIHIPLILFVLAPFTAFAFRPFARV